MLKEVVDINGDQVASNMKIDKDMILQKEPYQGQKRKRNSEEAASAWKEDSTLHEQTVCLEGSPFATDADNLGYGACSTS